MLARPLHTIIGVSVGRWREARGLQIVGRLKCRSPAPLRAALPLLAKPDGEIFEQRSGTATPSISLAAGAMCHNPLGRFRAFVCAHMRGLE